MKTYSTAETAKVLGVSRWTLITMVRRGDIHPVEGTGGQGRAQLFNKATVDAYAGNDDLAGVLARAVLGFLVGGIHPQALRYWAAHFKPDKDNKRGTRINYGLEYFDGKLPHVRPGYLTNTFDHDELIDHCQKIAASCTRGELEFLLATVFVSALPEVGHGVRTIRTTAQLISYESQNQGQAKRMARRPYKLEFDFWPRLPVTITGRSEEDKRVISDNDFFSMLTTNPTATGRDKNGRAIRAQIRRICSSLGTTVKAVQRDSESRVQSKMMAGKLPPASVVGRTLGIKRARAAQLWRGLDGRPEIKWFKKFFAPITTARGISKHATSAYLVN